ncbi:MAG: DegT/DnrJ/EryC1/StrS family aminotransferase [Roseomonas sp.]|nr:DegT/DnrJ/EryC1/StrS family aminotransferase [Roseomonas sp.]MCA3285066.1 DegT/DnrJ/EryC1/StrS family aminotransferase [Roseomonas sp.]MCA3290884.1 DegT/DnrJ/EryC1/StrS family aminotransferase [Roseomonas sp.]MCA3294988.1 DegT/DnrJ/EryC1/StrS family aminotransferase [Roseomonas sp.]MCA4918821.1 DegT/DnrJ/EryC1/StrS family aminotransferase [Roseomonas sp.]
MSEPRPIQLFDVMAQQKLIRPELDRRIAAVLDSGRFIMGPEVAELEAGLAAFVGAAHCVGVSSGTDALQIAMMAEGIGRGDAVFLPAFTYTATAEVPLVLGATPVFVDVDKYSYNMDIADLERRIAEVKRRGWLRPRAVVGVDLFGLPAGWPAIELICAREDMFALDDAAQAFGGSINGQKLGRWGHATALSFYPTKTLGAYGDAGALITDDPARAELYRSLRTHGEGKTRYEVERTGMNGRIDTIQATILAAKLPLLAGELAIRAKLAAVYNAALGGRVGIQAARAEAVNAWGLYTIRLRDADQRGKVQAALTAERIGSGIYYPKPLHRQPAYAAHHAAAFAGEAPPLAISERLAGQVLSLPMHAYMTEEDAARVAQVVLKNL